MKILVTGGAGFIGSHLVRKLLDLGHEVAVLDDFNPFYDPAIKRRNVESFGGREAALFESDICDAGAVHSILNDERFDLVIHLAARAGVRPSINHPRQYIETNVLGTYNLLEGARQAGTPRFIFASSSSVYGLAKSAPFSEELALPQTLSPYAATKLAAEQLCGNFAHLYGMQVICLRFFTVYGPAQRPDLAIHKFTDAIHHGRPIPKFGDGATRRDYTYIDDIIQGVIGAIGYDREKFRIFNLGESETTTLNELIAAIESSLGKRAIIEQLPEQPGDMRLTCADISRARRELGYAPATKIADGIPKFVEWYLDTHA